MQKRRSALKILAAFRKWKGKTTKFRWNQLFQRESHFKRNSSKNTTIVEKKEVFYRSLQLASESYKFMIDNDRLGDIVIIEQC